MTLAEFCPDCHGTRLGRYGKTAAGKQKYRCLACRRQFVAGSDHLVDPETRAIVIRMLSIKIEPTKIAEAMEGKISLRWIYQLKRKMLNNDRSD